MTGTGEGAIRELSFAEAIREALDIALGSDERVILMGEDIGVYGGAFQVTGDLVHKYGDDRVVDTPISELGGAGVAVGAAMTGLRPLFEFQFSDFATLAMEQIVNQAAKTRFMLGGTVSVPVVMRLPSGCGTGAARLAGEAWFPGVPGLKVVQPATPRMRRGCCSQHWMTRPMVIFEHKLLYNQAMFERLQNTQWQRSRALRGRDITIVATAIIHKAMDAADQLAQQGISAEVVDLRTIRPIDRDTVHDSVRRTGRLVCVYEGVAWCRRGDQRLVAN